jgi:alpha-L-rhamnosidase
MLGKDAISVEYAANAQRICDKFNAAFFDRETGWYAKNSQTAQALPLFLGMVPAGMKDKAEKRLLDAIEWNNGHISAGFLGANPVLEYLSLNGHEEVVFSMVSKPVSPGWLHHVIDAYSTMGENLNAKGYGSGHHPYGAHIGFWFFKFLGGIRPDINKPGFQEFIIKPMFVPEMDYVTVKTKSLYGEIVSSWKREGSHIILDVVVPGNTRATLLLPSVLMQVEINGKVLKTGEAGKTGETGKAGIVLEGGVWKIKFKE